MLWFILDSQKQPVVFVDGENVYAIANVVKADLSIINEDCDAEDF